MNLTDELLHVSIVLERDKQVAFNMYGIKIEQKIAEYIFPAIFCGNSQEML